MEPKEHHIRFQGKNGKWGVKNFNGDILIPATYGFIGKIFNENYFSVFTGDVNNECDQTARILDYYGYINEGSWDGSDILLMYDQAKWGVINSLNMVVIPPIYRSGSVSPSNLILVSKNAVIVKVIDYDDDDFEYWGRIGGRAGIIDIDDNIILPLEYDIVRFFNRPRNGYIFAQNTFKFNFDENISYDVYDYKGNLITFNPPIYSEYLRQIAKRSQRP